jgi:hypothetical protein
MPEFKVEAVKLESGSYIQRITIGPRSIQALPSTTVCSERAAKGTRRVIARTLPFPSQRQRLTQTSLAPRPATFSS